MEVWLVIGALIGAVAGAARGWSVIVGAVVGALLGPLAFALFLVSSVAGGRRCPECAGNCHKAARVCQWCRAELGGGR
jgi:hypothetical protein